MNIYTLQKTVKLAEEKRDQWQKSLDIAKAELAKELERLNNA